MALFQRVKQELNDPRYRGPAGKRGLQGPPGASGGIDEATATALRNRVDDLAAEIEALKNAEIQVVFEGGDEVDEPDVTVMLPVVGGTLVIPSQYLHILRLDASGNVVGDYDSDRAGLGQPLYVHLKEQGRGK